MTEGEPDVETQSRTNIPLSELDTTDIEILAALTMDARHTSTTDIAEEVRVTPPTIRKRIKKLETNDVIQEYRAKIDYHVLELLPVLFVCTLPVHDRRSLLWEITELPRVVQVRELHSGNCNLHISTVVKDKGHIPDMERELSGAGVEVESISLIHSEWSFPCTELQRMAEEDSDTN